VDKVEQRRDEQARVFAEPEVRSVHTIEILGHARRSLFEKGIIFQLTSTLFCEVKIGFVSPRRIVPFK
jgi:hypothetical protein